MTISTITHPTTAINTQQSLSISKSTDKQLLSSCTKYKIGEVVNELLNAIKISSCNHRDRRITKFEEREIKIRQELKDIELKNENDEVLLSLKDKEFDLGYIPCNNPDDCPLVDEYEELTQVHRLVRDPKLTEEERAIRDKDSLFHNRPDLKEHRLELLKIGHDIDKAIQDNPDKFVKDLKGSSAPVFYKKHKVIFKRRKNSSMGVFSYMLRRKIEELGLDKIVLPTREAWRERKFIDPKDSDEVKSSTIYIENQEKNLYSFLQSQYIYKNKSEFMTEAIEQFVILSCHLEVRDICMSDKRFEKYLNHYSKEGKDPKKWFCSEYRCNFDNLLLQKVTDEDGNDFCKFVLADIDVVSYPCKATVSNLLGMFPDHSDLIIRLVSEHNPSLLEDMTKETREDSIPRYLALCTKPYIIESYKREPRFGKNYSKQLKDKEKVKLVCSRKFDRYKKLINMKKEQDSTPE